MKKKAKKKRSQASYQSPFVHSDKLSSYSDGKMSKATNKTGAPTNRADSELNHLMGSRPAGMAQASRRNK